MIADFFNCAADAFQKPAAAGHCDPEAA
jgi:hypothetical protein